ncbi:MAG TPA: hypothetical protein VG407_17590 [Caulobacteraceae bacterium]|jgi:hypothetical protein|nr:hypothetical protein [Caulobacteraceae bacterium]
MSAVDDDPILGRFADPLAAYLHRTADQIRQAGLTDDDFSEGLEISFADGSHAQFNAAFLVVSADGAGVAVFTQACGYFEFDASQIEFASASRAVFGHDQE